MWWRTLLSAWWTFQYACASWLATGSSLIHTTLHRKFCTFIRSSSLSYKADYVVSVVVRIVFDVLLLWGSTCGGLQKNRQLNIYIANILLSQKCWELGFNFLYWHYAIPVHSLKCINHSQPFFSLLRSTIKGNYLKKPEGIKTASLNTA